jgi:PKD domain
VSIAFILAAYERGPNAYPPVPGRPNAYPPVPGRPLQAARFVRRRPHAVALMLGAVAALIVGAHAVPARATILPAVTIDGPSEEIVGFGGVAMAEDGTGGLVYLKQVAGVPHVFVSRYLEGRWLAPIRADIDQPYAASWPRIAAADDGELVVVWATPFATEHNLPVDELLGSTLGAGSSTFGPPMIVDPDIRAGVGTSPDLSMSSTGQADVVYRVVADETGRVSSIPLLRPGDVVEEVRVAHFNGETWTGLGAINRDPGISMRPPTQLNAPQIVVGPTGNGIVVWQEPDIEGVARIWARRLFKTTLNYVLPVSATSLAGTPIGLDADAPSVTLSRLGQAEVAYRQAAGPGSPLPGPRIFLNTLPDGESAKASGAEFLGAGVADADVPGGAGATVGPPSIDIDEKRDVRLLYDGDGTPRVVEGNDRGLTGTLSLGPPFAGSELSSASVMNPAGGGVSAWPSVETSNPAVAVREDFPEGAVQTALVGGGAGGPIGELAVGRSGLGDGLVAFQQGPLGNAAIVAAQVTAPPAELILSTPTGWVKPARAEISWVPVLSANGPLSYRIVIDGRPLATRPGAFAMRLSQRGLGDGVHRIQLLVTDIYGQSTLSSPQTLRVDGTPPAVAIKRTQGGYAVSVGIRDAYSGVDTRAVSVSFGDGHHAGGRKRLSHRYSRPGIYQVVVRVRDRLGNSGVVRRLVSVR